MDYIIYPGTKNRTSKTSITEKCIIRKIKLADQISGGELDARNESIPIEERRIRLPMVRQLAQACAGVNTNLDNLFDAVYSELEWFLKAHS